MKWLWCGGVDTLCVRHSVAARESTPITRAPMTTDSFDRDLRWRLQRRVDDSITWMSIGVLALIVSGALVFILRGGWYTWFLLAVGTILLVMGWLGQWMARRAQKRHSRRMRS